MARPSQPRITRSKAVEASLEIIDREGLEGFGIEQVAQALGVRAPSLYHHFEGKADLMAQIARYITLDVQHPPEPASDDDWVEWFVEIATRFRRSVLKHPNAAPLLVQYFPRRFTLNTYELGTEYLRRGKVPVALHAMLFEGMDRLTFGSALFAAMRPDDSLFPGLDPERDPGLLAAVEANPWPDEELFQVIIRSFIHGAVSSYRETTGD